MAEVRWREFTILLDDKDYERLKDCRFSAGGDSDKRYARVKMGGHWYLLHRVIAGAKPGEIVDHINGNKLDSRRCNLRITDALHNSYNRGAQRKNTTCLHGVTKYSKTTYKVSIGSGGKYLRCCGIRDVVVAALIADIFSIRFFGEYARLNRYCYIDLTT
jgi:hypothetical protein